MFHPLLLQNMPPFFRSSRFYVLTFSHGPCCPPTLSCSSTLRFGLLVRFFFNLSGWVPPMTFPDRPFSVPSSRGNNIIGRRMPTFLPFQFFSPTSWTGSHLDRFSRSQRRFHRLVLSAPLWSLTLSFTSIFAVLVFYPGVTGSLNGHLVTRMACLVDYPRTATFFCHHRGSNRDPHRSSFVDL